MNSGKISNSLMYINLDSQKGRREYRTNFDKIIIKNFQIWGQTHTKHIIIRYLETVLN